MSILKYEQFEKGHLNEEAEGQMYLQKLQNIVKFAQDVMDLISDDDDLEAWVQDKITIAEHNMDAILGYYQSSKDGSKKGLAKQVDPAMGQTQKLLFDRKK